MDINNFNFDDIDPTILENAKNILAANGIEPDKIDNAINSVQNSKIAKRQVGKIVSKKLREYEMDLPDGNKEN